MEQRMMTFDLLRSTPRMNDWMEEIPEWSQVGSIRAAVSAAGGSIQELNQLLRIESTHTAVTQDPAPRPGDRLRENRQDAPGECYRIEYITDGPRMRLMHLKRETEAQA